MSGLTSCSFKNKSYHVTYANEYVSISYTPDICSSLDTTRWHWDRELNPLMQLVMATESIAPQSPPSLPFPFPFQSGSIYTQRKRRMSISEGSKNVSSNDLPTCSASLDKSETKHGKKYRNGGTEIKSNGYAESPKSSCTLNLDWERMEFIVDRESNLILPNGEGNISAEVLEEVEVEPQITAKSFNTNENRLYGIRENDSRLDTSNGEDLVMRSDCVDGTLNVADLKQKGTEMEDSRDPSGPAFDDGGSEPGLNKAALYSAVSGCFRELSRRHSKGTASSHPLPKIVDMMTGFSVALTPSSQPRSLHLPLSLPLPQPPSHNAPQSHCATLLLSSSSSISLCHAPLSMSLPLCAPPTAWSLALHPSSSSLLSPSHDAIKETTHYCDDDEVVHSYEGDAYCEKEKKRKPYPCKITSPVGTGKENECPQSIGGKGLKCLKKSKASSTDSKRNILGPIRVAEVGSTDSCADISSDINIETAHSALAVSQECSSRSSELAFEELEQWYLKWKFVLHPTN